MKNILIILLIAIQSIALVAQTSKPVRAIQPITLEMKMEFLALVNAERAKAGIRPYKYSFEADTLAKRRNQTVMTLIYTSDSVEKSREMRMTMEETLHYQADSDFVWFNREIVPQDSTSTWRSECAGSMIYPETKDYSDSHFLVYDLFNGWKNSPDHWKMIMEPKLQYMALSWSNKTGRIISHLVIFDKKARENPKFKKYTGEPLDQP